MPDLTFKTAGVVATNEHASDASLQMFKSGGNAVDAAVAGMLATCVTAPFSVGIGGYGGAFVMYHAASESVVAVDFDSRAPFAYKPELFKDANAFKTGYLAVGVPGVVSGFDLIIRRFGTKKWADVCAPAIALAEEGFVVTPVLTTSFKEFISKADPVSMKALLPSGAPPKTGEKWVQKDLGRLIRRIAADARSLYEGEIPRTIVKQVKANGGILAEEDFVRFRARAVAPLGVNYQGFDLHTPPPPSGGVTTLSILKTLEDFDLASREKWGAPYFELYSEASRLCWDERRRLLGDPDMVHPPLEEMLSEKSAKARGHRIRNGPRLPFMSAKEESEHTSNIVTVDAQRNLVSLTATQGDAWGAHVVIEGLGLVIGHTMSRFEIAPGHPNSAAPGKRVQHNMSPLVITKSGKPFATIGMPGGPRIPTVTGQAVVSVLDFKASPTQAVNAPRVTTEGDEPLIASKNLPAHVLNELRLMGHEVVQKGSTGGPLGVIVLNEAGTFGIAGTPPTSVEGL